MEVELKGPEEWSLSLLFWKGHNETIYKQRTGERKSEANIQKWWEILRKRWNNSKAGKVACIFADYTPVPGPVSQDLAEYWDPDPLSYMRLIFLYLSQCGGVSESYKQKISVEL